VVAAPLGPERAFVILFKDETERHAADQAREAQGHRFRALADELPVIAWLHDREGELAFVNQTYCDYFGVERGDMVEGRWQALTHPDDGASYADDFADAVRERRRFENRVRVQRADGAWRWMESWGQPRLDDEGHYLGHIGASLDVTERVELEHQRAELLERERAARHHAEVLERHAVRLSACVTADDVARCTLDHLDVLFDLTATAVNLPAGDQLRVVPGSGVSGEIQFVDADASLPGPDAVSTGKEIHLDGRDVFLAHYPHLDEMFDRYDLETVIALPLLDQTRTPVGAVVGATRSGRRLEAGEIELMRRLVARSGVALDRALLYERLREAHGREREIAVRLQRALLPERVVSADGVEIETRYFAADDVMQVGGDWFDTFRWSTGEIAVVVGDVVGHDLDAAAKMGRLRAATASLIPLGDPRPAAVLDALERAARGPARVDFVTAACVVLDPVAGQVRYASAGHPPPLLIQPDGSVRWLDGATVVPIGQIEIEQWAEQTIDVTPGTVVLLYTDGLVERRGNELGDGLQRLAAAAPRLLVGDLAAAVDALVATLVDVDASDDDVIVAALRWAAGDQSSTGVR
jgi:PAS domain S-box-containing protein